MQIPKSIIYLVIGLALLFTSLRVFEDVLDYHEHKADREYYADSDCCYDGDDWDTAGSWGD